MPLHEWTDRFGWEGVHHLWIAELFHWVKERLPSGYRAFIGSSPTLAVDSSREKPDVGVQSRLPEETTLPGELMNHKAADAEMQEPEQEMAVSLLVADTAVMVERGGHLIAAIELISPRNKDRPTARTIYLTRYLGYLLRGVNLLLVDVHRRPLAFSFADRIAAELNMPQPPTPAPLAVSYRVGEPAATGGRFLARWRRQLLVGDSLPTLPLALTVKQAVAVDLEATYQRAAETYLS